MTTGAWRGIACNHQDSIWTNVGSWSADATGETHTIWACTGCDARFLHDTETGAITNLTIKITKTDDGVGSQPVTPAGPAVSPPAPSSPRTFELVRHHDVSGQTGTGVVAEGVQFTDGTAALRWRGGHPATAVWPNVEEILAVHGHEGASEIRWLDGV